MCQAKVVYFFEYMSKRNNVTKRIQALSFVLFTVFAYTHSFAQSFVVKGVVLDKSNKSPLPSTYISIPQAKIQTYSNHNGSFEFVLDTSGNYFIHLEHLVCEHLDVSIWLSKDTFLTIYLPHSSNVLKDAHIHAENTTTVQHNTKINSAELEKQTGKTLAQLTENLPGVSSLTTGNTVFKPVVNGLFGFRVLLVHNEIRQEGQNWGQEHAPEIDPMNAKEIILLKGYQSLRYGPENIGGVLLINGPSIFNYRAKHLTGSVHSSFASNGLGHTYAANLGGKFGEKLPLFWRVQGSWKEQGNLKTPDYYLNNTGLNERNWSMGLGTMYKKWTFDFSYAMFQSTFGIYSGAHIGNLTDLNNAINGLVPPQDMGFSYAINRPNQSMLHETFRLKTHYKIKEHQYLKLILARQFNQRQEYDYFLVSNTGPQLDYIITTHTADLVFDKQIKPGFDMQLGLQAMQQANTYRGRYFLPNYSLMGAGAFAGMQKEVGKWNFSGSLRSDYRGLSAFYNQNDSLQNPTRDFMNIAALANVDYAHNPSNKLSVRILRTWRPPMPNELYSRGIHHGAASYEEGRADLKTEISHKAELEWFVKPHKNLEIQSTVFIQHIQDFISLVPAAEAKQTIRGAFPYFYYTSAEAVLQGYSFHAMYSRRNFKVDFTGNMLLGFDQKTKTFLQQMPPFRFAINPSYTYKKIEFKLRMLHVLRQFRYEPNSDFAPPPNAYLLFGADLQSFTDYKTHKFKYFVSVDNALNQEYKDYLDRFRYFSHRPGVNVRFGLNIHFDFGIKHSH